LGRLRTGREKYKCKSKVNPIGGQYIETQLIILSACSTLD
jgi:hypothetical protein